ncbi:hypothetical protein Bbelb_406430 [Branchiostoma belcheri]|nr:hypothetical protein Bbelb_406430 [Branchiostoma belcheri]
MADSSGRTDAVPDDGGIEEWGRAPRTCSTEMHMAAYTLTDRRPRPRGWTPGPPIETLCGRCTPDTGRLQKAHAYLRCKEGELLRATRGLTRDGRRDVPTPAPDPRSHPMEAIVASFEPHPRFDIVAQVRAYVAQVRAYTEQVRNLPWVVEELKERVKQRLGALPNHDHHVLYYIARGLGRGTCTWEEPIHQRPELWTAPDPIGRAEREAPE